MSETRDSQDPQPEDLASYFDRSASAVRVYADRFEHVYARPAINTGQSYFDQYPMSSTFVVIFSLLSSLPIVSFIGISLFAIASFTFVALSCALLASVAVVISLVSILLCVLLVILFVSAFLTVFIISTYLAVRFVILIRHDGRVGVSEWATETKDRFVHAKNKLLSKADDNEGSERSSGSIVVVNEKKTEIGLNPPNDVSPGTVEGE